MVERFFPAFAAFAGPQSAPTYKQWIQKVRKSEYADELIVAAAAAELELRIVCVPYSPGPFRWKISTYCGAPTAEVPDEGRTVYLGNNDVHYMWLSPT